MSLLLVAARSLHQRRVRLHDAPLERASLFPFFDRQGRVRALMLVWPPASHIVVLEHLPDLVRVPWGGEIELRVDLAALRDVDARRAEASAGLWHYDPWWVLRAACFEGHAAVPALKATNCAGAFLKPIYGCFFSRDLSRLVGVTTKSRNHSGLSALDTTYRPFSPELLPEEAARARPQRPAREWALDPFWLRDSWRPTLSRSHRHF